MLKFIITPLKRKGESSSRSSQGLVVPELLEMVVEHVDDRFTLNSLLTTNKVLFEAAVPRLYADPFRYARHSPRACMKLFKWILTLSPSTRPEVEALRTELGITKQPYQQPPRVKSPPNSGQSSKSAVVVAPVGPSINYLSFVRHARIQLSDYVDIETNRALKKMMAPVLPWVICEESQFDRIQSISIVSGQADAFLTSVSSMSSLKNVYWDPTPYDKSRDMAAIRRFVEAFVEANGERGGRSLSMFFECDVEDREDRMNFVIPELVDIYRLLDPLPPSKNAIMTSNSWMRCLAHKDSMDFSNIQKIDMIPDKELLTILPRCHGLESLSCGVGVLSTRLFQWVAEARGNTPSGARDDSPSSIVPLKLFKSNIRRSVVKRTLRDLKAAFETTLEELELTISRPTPGIAGLEEDDEEDGLNPMFVGSARVVKLGSELNLPKLRHLAIRGRSCQCYLVIDDDMAFEDAPQLESLVLEDPSSSFSDSERLFQEVQNDSSTSLQTTATTDQLDLVPCLEWYLPKLQELELHGASAAQFHPDTLQWTSRLERLVLNMKSSYLKMPRLLANWAERSWSWHLPVLRLLVLAGPGALMINLAALQMQLPALEDLTLMVGNLDENTGSLATFLKRGDRASTASFNRPSPLGHPLKRLRLKGRWKMMSLDLVALLDKGLFPELQELWVANIPWIVADLTMDRAAHHPSLNLFWLTTRGGHVDANARAETIRALKLFPMSERPKKQPVDRVVIGLDRKWYLKSRSQPSS